METNRQIRRHWLYVARHFSGDVGLFVLAFALGTILRFGSGWTSNFLLYMPSIVIGGLALACFCYLGGLYSPYRVDHRSMRRFLFLAIVFHAALFVVVATGYVNWSARIGRGVMLLGFGIAAATAFAHHIVLYLHLRSFRERIAFLVSDESDEEEADLVKKLGGSQLEFVGMVAGSGYVPDDGGGFLGDVSEFDKIIGKHRIARVLCTASSMEDPSMRQILCQLRYSGVTVGSLVSLCEEVYQLVPLNLVTPGWLLRASDSPHLFYIKKVKRAFDVAVSLLGLLLLGPFALLGMIATKLSSPGPIFYRQRRVGRFGRPFDVIKLRTMRTDAEKDGAQWSVENDPRVTRVGHFLRKYRIDEIPQLANVLRGEMSFVGPRPERPEFTDDLAQDIPFFKERLLVQPGITGWAQVRFPYGSSISDARRKLEYDLYYMKHMSVFLDLFILLDTVLIILRGGLGSSHRTAHPLPVTLTDPVAVPEIQGS